MSALDELLRDENWQIAPLTARAELAKLRAALDEAIDLAEEAIGYTDSYFRKKWGMPEQLADLKRIREKYGREQPCSVHNQT